MEHNKPGPRMIYIPGKTKDIKSFWIDETLVTVAQYREAVNAGAVSRPEREVSSNYYLKGREDHPINCVNYYQASAYAKWAGKRLPKREEWIWAAQGGQARRKFPWGTKDPSDQLCWSGLGNDLGFYIRQSTSPVGSYPKGDSKHGLKDMAGNVREWVEKFINNKATAYVRGSGWLSEEREENLCIYYEMRLRHQSFVDVGFRCVKDLR